MEQTAEEMLDDIEATARYAGIALDACHKRIAELETALRKCRQYFDDDGYGEYVADINKVLAS